jgi:hypothetical protein
MMRFALGVVAAFAIPAASVATATASDRHPWCLVVQDWGDGWSCGFDSFAACTAEARAGNVGYCAANPAYPAPAPAKTPRERRKPPG